MSLLSHYAIIPAAGRSLRMGSQHKLLLPWQQNLVIDQVLQAWTDSRISRAIVVVRAADESLQAACRNWPVDVVTPDVDPADMKASIRLGLEFVADRYHPRPGDRWLTAPADLPTLTTDLINLLIQAGQDTAEIVAPRFGDRCGHPVSFPWKLFQPPGGFADIPADQGLNWLLQTQPVHWIEQPADKRPADIDTPQDYAHRRATDGLLGSSLPTQDEERHSSR